MRIMAIDLGDERTGLAVSDPLGMLCGEAWTVKEWDKERLAETVCLEAEQRGVERLVLGLPKNMDGSEGERAKKSRGSVRAGLARLRHFPIRHAHPGAGFGSKKQHVQPPFIAVREILSLFIPDVDSLE